MNKRLTSCLKVLIGSGIVALCVATSAWVAYQLALRDQQHLASQLAEQILRRNERISDQVRSALYAMDEVAKEAPCSAKARSLMARIVLRSSLLQAVAWVREDRIVCASVDVKDVPIGKSDFVIQEGASVRVSRQLPMIDPQATFRITQALDTGYAVIINTELAFDILPQTSKAAVGIVGSQPGQVISQTGTWQPAWQQRLDGTGPVSFTDADHVVALRPSGRYKYFAYAALPMADVHAAWASAARVALPLGLAAGAVLTLLVLAALRRQAGLPTLLRQALRSDKELYVHYQPFVDLQTRRWVGAEALIRWRRPDGEMVRPDLFIPVAEQHGLISQVTDKLLRMVRRDLGELLRQHPDFFVSINVAAQDLLDEGFAQRLAALVREWGIAPLQLRLEATEHSLIDAQAAHVAIARLQALGHRIALDDFGTGYSSLSYLATLKVDSIKIDKSFVDTIGTDAVTAQMVPHILDIGKTLGLRLIGEGIETAAQAAYLTEHGVTYGQGWFFEKAINPKELEKKLQEAHRTS